MIIKTVIVEVRGLPIVLSDNIKAFGVHGPVAMDEKDIFTCIAKGAYVWEVKPDGSKVKLDFTNYNKEDGSTTKFMQHMEDNETMPATHAFGRYKTPEYQNVQGTLTIATADTKEQSARQQNGKQNKYNKNKHKN